MADLRLPRLDDGAAAFIRQQAEARGCTPQAVVERMVRLTLIMAVESEGGEGAECATDFLERAQLEPARRYFSAAPPAA